MMEDTAMQNNSQDHNSMYNGCPTLRSGADRHMCDLCCFIVKPGQYLFQHTNDVFARVCRTLLFAKRDQPNVNKAYVSLQAAQQIVADEFGSNRELNDILAPLVCTPHTLTTSTSCTDQHCCPFDCLYRMICSQQRKPSASRAAQKEYSWTSSVHVSLRTGSESMRRWACGHKSCKPTKKHRSHCSECACTAQSTCVLLATCTLHALTFNNTRSSLYAIVASTVNVHWAA